MIRSRDEIKTFLPIGKPKFVILGTMASVCARSIAGNSPTDIFFYQDGRNQFWNVIQRLMNPTQLPSRLSKVEKMAFLEHHKIAVTNLVEEIEVEMKDAKDPSDTVLFKAAKSGHLKFKSIDGGFKEVLSTAPLLFTCRVKPGIKNLLNGFLEHNGLDVALRDKILFLPTPTRCNAEARAAIWRNEIESHLKKSG